MKYNSPDSKHSIRLIYESEIRFGPAYYKVGLDGREIAGTLFGDVIVWASHSKYVALQRWLQTSEREGPDTTLYVIDLETLHSYSRPRAQGGFITPLKFKGHKVMYKKTFHANAAREEEYEVDLKEAKDWSKIQFK